MHLANKLFSVFLVFAVLAGSAAVEAGAQAASLPPDTPNVTRAKALLDKTIEALGGETYLTVRDMTRRGRAFGFNRGDSTGASEPVLRIVKFPDKERLEIGKGGQIIEILNGDQGWVRNREGISDMPPAEMEILRERNRRSLDYLLRIRMRTERVFLEYLGGGFIDNTVRVERIEIRGGNEEPLQLAVDASTFLPLEFRSRRRDPKNGTWAEEVRTFGRYTRACGMAVPRQVIVKTDGVRISEVSYEEISCNAGVDDSQFTREALEKLRKR